MRNCLSKAGSSWGWRRVKRGISSPLSTSRNWERKGSWGHSSADARGSTPLRYGIVGGGGQQGGSVCQEGGGGRIERAGWNGTPQPNSAQPPAGWHHSTAPHALPAPGLSSAQHSLAQAGIPLGQAGQARLEVPHAAGAGQLHQCLQQRRVQAQLLGQRSVGHTAGGGHGTWSC